MPQNEAFWNPYRLIPSKPVNRKPPVTDEKFRGKSGMIYCSLENLTLLFVGSNEQGMYRSFIRKNGRPVIPGSSLKGMLRSLAEIVGGGCYVTGFNGGERAKYGPCNRAWQLCIACRMFGMMERGRGARVHKGKIGISDALICEEKPNLSNYQVLLANCGTRHEPFYRSPSSGTLDGKSRKLFFHQPAGKASVPPVEQKLQSRAWFVNALEAGHHFDFTVQFSNLEEDELNLLLYTLVLEDSVQADVQNGDGKLKFSGPMRHKIGSAKPLGMGSCKVDIQKIEFMPPPSKRFTSLKGGVSEIYEGDRLQEMLTGNLKGFASDTSDTMQQLRKMMVWDENDPRAFHYPHYTWFKNAANSQTPLKSI